jgi:hypothetical protein
MRHECGLESAGSGRHSSSPALPTRSALGQDAGHKDRRTCRHVLTPGPASSAVSAPASPPGGTRKDAVTFTRHPAPPASRTTVARAPGGGTGWGAPAGAPPAPRPPAPPPPPPRGQARQHIERRLARGQRLPVEVLQPAGAAGISRGQTEVRAAHPSALHGQTRPTRRCRGRRQARTRGPSPSRSLRRACG